MSLIRSIVIGWPVSAFWPADWGTQFPSDGKIGLLSTGPHSDYRFADRSGVTRASKAYWGTRERLSPGKETAGMRKPYAQVEIDWLRS
jgi:hypothetical protein